MKLSGVKVLDLTSNMPGPYLSMLMADNGAEVVKVENPNGGDAGRELGIHDGESTIFFRNLNRGKKSITLDLKSDDGRESFLSLCERFDVVLEGGRPGVAKRLGIDYETVAQRNPGIVYCSISAYGQYGRYCAVPAHSLAVESLSGAVSLTEGDDGEPTIPGIAVADFLSGLHGLAGVLMALLRRNQTGMGDYLDISMLDSTIAALPNVVSSVFARNEDVVPKLERNLGGAGFYRVYATKDGLHVALAGQEEKFVRTVLKALNRPDLVELCLRGPGAHQRPVVEFFKATFRQKTQAEWLAFFEPLNVCFAPVMTVREMLADPNTQERGMILTDAKGRKHLGPAIKFLREPAQLRLQEPALGANNKELLNPAA